MGQDESRSSSLRGALQTRDIFGICSIPNAAGPSDSHGDAAIILTLCCRAHGCVSHPRVFRSPAPPPSRGSRAARASGATCHRSQDPRACTGWHYCIKNPGWPLEMLFWGMIPRSPKGSPRAPQTQWVLSVAGTRPHISPEVFLFQGDGGVSALGLQ